MLWLVIGLVLIFGFVVLVGAPYLPTLAREQRNALDLMNLKPGQTVLDIGSGDGRFLLEAARCGYQAVGIELNPLLVIVSYIVCWRYRAKVKIIWANMWQISWPPADGIYVFLHSRFMNKLHNKIVQEYSGKKVNVVSYAFEIPGKNVVKKHGGLFLYKF